tara:strand:- start:3394 stop:4122 length:729 start_codon:yes stop_codon:yes gene_type:complete
MAFSMQDLMGKLPGSPGGQPQVAPNFNPQINKKQLATDVQVNKDIIKADKNQQLGLMLHALGGALRGDENFVQNTMALQNMQEGKKKKEERDKRFKELLAKTPEGSMRDLMVAVGSEKIDTIAGEIFKSQQPLTERPTAAAQNYASLQKIKETGTAEDIALAEKVFAGINAGKTETQTLQATAASLAKTVNPITQELYTPEEIQAQLDNLKNIFKQFSMPKTEDITDDKKVTTVAGFQVEEI